MVWLPEQFLERMKEMLGDEYGEFLASYEKPRTYGLRVNTLKMTTEEFERLGLFSATGIPWVENGYFYPGDVRPSAHPLYAAGAYYLQEPSAMTPAACLGVKPGERVLDLCAAPGGKATELGARLRGEGLLVANDISTSRARALLYNLEVSGVENAFVTNETPERLAEVFAGYFDRILVDAPCSGEGMFRKEEAVARDWSPEKSETLSRQQREILSQAVRMLKPGGTLLYSTCTFAPCEDEQTVCWLLEQFPDLHLVPLPQYEGFSGGRPSWGDGREELELCVRIWPHRMEGEGHFLAKFEKNGAAEGDVSGKNSPVKEQEPDAAESNSRRNQGKGKGQKKRGRKDAADQNRDTKLSRQEESLIREFLLPCTKEFSMAQMEKRGQKVYFVPELPEGVRHLKFLRNGLYFGELRKDRFEPSQQLAMCLSAEEFTEHLCLNPEDERAARYLKGETLSVSPEETAAPAGWKLVCVGNCPLGWGRLVQGVLKNKYQNSWRRK